MLNKLIAVFFPEMARRRAEMAHRRAERRVMERYADFFERFPRPGAPVRIVTEREAMEGLERALAMARIQDNMSADQA